MKLYKSLSLAAIERQVEDAYNDALKSSFAGIKLEYPFACDGYCEFGTDDKKHRLIIEYKYDEDMASSVSRAKVLAQILFYLKKFEDNGRVLPNVLLVADKNECFVMHTNALLKHLDAENVDWSKAPSNAGSNGDLVLAISEDKDINPFVFDVNDSFDFNAVAEKIKDVANGAVRLVRITEHNVDKVFKLFSEKIVLEKKFPPNDMVALFFAVVTGSEDVYLHPTKKNSLVYNGKNVKCDSSKFKAFCGHFSTTCSPKEKARLAAISDRLIEDTNRRRKGEFYTPTAFVDFSHNIISQHFGIDWKDKYVVIDCCCGCKNLTRDYKFKKLYCSTLEQAELDISKNYNPEAVSFQFDFLNDTLEKMPASLIECFKQNKPVLWFINPPYGSNCGKGASGRMKSKIAELMSVHKMRAASSVMYGEFLYRICLIKEQYHLTDCNIALFCKPSFLTIDKFDEFRKMFLDQFEFIDGFMFQASHFGDVSGAWGVAFNIWKSGKTLDKNNFAHKLIDLNDDGDIVEIGQKTLYNIDGLVDAKTWCETTTNYDKVDMLCSTGGINIKGLTKHAKDALGYIFANGNSVYYNETFLALQTAPMYKCITPIYADNFDRACAYFAARAIVNTTWINDKDEYIAPNDNNLNFNAFMNDAIVYDLFASQLSLRNMSLDGNSYDIKNEFFWIPAKQMEEWANEAGLDELYNDAHTSNDRFACKKLQGLALSAEAKAVLDKATKLVHKSMKYRKLFDDEHPEYQLTKAHDAGWYQIRAMLKEYMPDELKEFKELYKKLADTMRPQIYSLGFLKK